MYLEEANIEYSSLRQGDIVSKVLLLGAINPNAINFLSDQTGKTFGWSIHNEPIYSDAMILSHSCEIANENGIKFTSVILAPIRDINSATEKNKVEELIQTNFVKEGVKKTFLKYFYIEPHEKLAHKSGAIVDFSKIFSVRKNYFEELRKKKVLQLKEDVSKEMSKKLALYFHRFEEPTN